MDGSGWRGVYDLLARDGFGVRVVENPTKSLADDAATTRHVLDQGDGSVVLVGHSYGGAVITEAGTHPRVAARVYITAFAPDQGESVNTLIAGFPQDGPQPPILPRDGYLFLDRDTFHDSFAADLSCLLQAAIVRAGSCQARLRATWMSVCAARRASGTTRVVLDEADSAAAPS